MRAVLTLLAFVVACGSEASEPRRNLPEPIPTTEAALEPSEASQMSVRSAPAEVPVEDVEQWRNLVAKSRTQSRESMRRGETAVERARREGIERAGERARNISPERASQLVKAMLRAGMNAPDDDPCARVEAMYDLASDELELGSELREQALRRCAATPQARLACLKPMSERSPFERRLCRRFLREADDAPDLFGETRN